LSQVVNLPERLYKSIEKVALIKGVTPEELVISILNLVIEHIAADIDAYYTRIYSRAESEALNRLKKAIKEKEINLKTKSPEKLLKKYIYPLGRLLTILSEAYGKIPFEVRISDLKNKEKLPYLVYKHVGRVKDPVSLIEKYILERVRPIAPAFGIKIEEKDNDIVVSFNNPAYLESLVPLGSRVLRRRVRK